jgi:hypothetical protein
VSLTSKLVTRATILVLALLALALTLLSFQPALLASLVGLWANRPPDATPPPPIITAPQGQLPATNLAFSEWVESSIQDYHPVGSAFLLQLPTGPIIGVTTAHSVGDLGDPANQVEQVAFQIPNHNGFIAEFDTLYTNPGFPRTGDDLTVDYILLQATTVLDPTLAFQPDPRGTAQPGERVSVISGLGDGAGGRRLIGGTVQSVDPQSLWVLMDEMENPSGLSGSPFVSDYTGKVIGMAIATQARGNRFLLGLHPIASLLILAAAPKPTKISDYSR